MSAKIMRENFLLVATAFSVHTGLPLTSISKKFYGKQDFIERYRAGEVSPTINNYYALIDAFARAWPPGAPWPETSPIPKLGKNLQNDRTDDARAEGIG